MKNILNRKQGKVNASILLNDLKGIEDYLLNENSEINLRYFEDWKDTIEKCPCLSLADIQLLCEIYSGVYNYNYQYKLKEANKEIIKKESIIYHSILQGKIFDYSKESIDLKKYSPQYKHVLESLESYLKIRNKKFLTHKSGRGAGERITLILSIITVIISSITMLTSIFSNYQVSRTIKETIISRNMQYKAELKINPTAYGMTWDENGQSLSQTDSVYQEVGRFTHDSGVDNYPIIEIKNIGVGVAKDIVLTWDDKYNLNILNEELKQAGSNTSVYLKDGLVVMEEKNKQNSIVPQTVQEEVFIPADTTDYSFINFPATYYDLIKKIVIEGIDYNWSIILKATCHYKDLQDNDYDASIEFNLTPNFCYSYGKEDLSDGKDGCVLKIKSIMKLNKR